VEKDCCWSPFLERREKLRRIEKEPVRYFESCRKTVAGLPPLRGEKR
jgi:hypothetical protein